MSNLPVPELPGNTFLSPIHKYAYELNLEGIQSEVGINLSNLNLYTTGNAAVHPLYMVFLRIDNEKPSSKLLEIMDFFLQHPKLDKMAVWRNYSTWYDAYGSQVSINLFGLFLMKTIDKQKWYSSQFIKCLMSGADVRVEFGIKPLLGVRYRDYIIAAPDELYSSLMIKALIGKNDTEQLTWKGDSDTFSRSVFANSVTLHKNNVLFILLESKLFSASAEDETGKSILHYAVSSKESTLSTYSILLEFGADVNHRTKGKTALEEFLELFANRELNASEKNLIWNMCILSIEYGYQDLNQLYEMVTKRIQLGAEYYLPIEQVFYDTD